MGGGCKDVYGLYNDKNEFQFECKKKMGWRGPMEVEEVKQVLKYNYGFVRRLNLFLFCFVFVAPSLFVPVLGDFFFLVP